MFGFRRKKPAFVPPTKKEKKRTHKKTLEVEKYYVTKVQPLSVELFSESKAKMDELARKDKERIMLEEAKNRVESYSYLIKNKLIDDEENIAKVSTDEQREEIRQLAADATDWLDFEADGADLETMEAKYKELSEPAEKIWSRMKELTARPEAIAAMNQKLDKIEELLGKWETTMPQVTDEEKADVRSKIDEVKKWIQEKAEEQDEKALHEEPAFSSEEVPLQSKSLEKLVMKLSKKPKPKVEKKEEEKAANETATGGEEEEKTTESASEEETTEEVKEEMDETTETKSEEETTEEVKDESDETPEGSASNEKTEAESEL